MRAKISFLLVICLFCTFNLSAQKNSKKIVITGNVRDASGSPIVNAMVLIDGQKTNSVTNSLGRYKARVKTDASRIGIFTFGNGIIEDSINGRTRIDFNFSNISAQRQESEVPPGDEAVNLGYAQIKMKRTTNNISTLYTKDSKRTYRDIYEMLKEIPGIWNKTAWNLSGPVGPAFYVNGVLANDISYIVPSEVESITFLKDASAAMFGINGFGGVILIKTKIP
jgi:TonB-dependent starch-binding outer membrane protein SusC